MIAHPSILSLRGNAHQYRFYQVPVHNFHARIQMKKRELRIARSYDPRTQSRIGLFVAQLDDQLKRLKSELAGLSVEQLEWQMKPGMNTIGMLLAHLALVDVWWLKAAPAEIPWDPDAKLLIQRTCGIEDDGLPLPPDGAHPAYLKGFTIEKYFIILDKGRRAAHSSIRKWRDKDLDKLFRVGKRQVTPAWALYHTLEHFAGHFGQILLIKHLMRDAGVLQMHDI
jgi:uncharacterized damage-inducible protein DinB